MTRFLPFDYYSAVSNADWRKTLWWPQKQNVLREIGYELASRLALLAFRKFHGEVQRSLILAAPGLTNQALISLEAAWSLALARDSGWHIKASDPEFHFLAKELDDLPPQKFRRQPVARPRGEILVRRIARTASWTSPINLPRALLRPKVFAVNHNELLRQEAKAAAIPMVGVNGDDFLISAYARLQERHRPDEKLVTEIVDEIINLAPADEEIRERLRVLLSEKVRFNIGTAMDDLVALRGIQLPASDLWAGTGGNRVTRAIAMEVVRQGGSVWGFDHGGSTGMLASGIPLAMSEGAVASQFVAMSSRSAQMCISGPLGQEIRKLRPMSIIGGRGDPHIKSMKFSPVSPRSGRPRVMLITGAILGYRQINPALPRDPVYLDWHMRLAEMLQSLPYEVILKPHPEGLFRGQKHPLESVGPVMAKPFEQSIGVADLLIFDFPLSTTFWTAMCSNHPIVFAELGVAPLNDQVVSMIRRRCQHVPAEWGDNGLPMICRERLGEAILEGLRTPPDPTEFREFFLGFS